MEKNLANFLSIRTDHGQCITFLVFSDATVASVARKNGPRKSQSERVILVDTRGERQNKRWHYLLKNGPSSIKCVGIGKIVCT